jgi:hypothetical protein
MRHQHTAAAADLPPVSCPDGADQIIAIKMKVSILKPSVAEAVQRPVTEASVIPQHGSDSTPAYQVG